jgi:hypothetical protein
MKQWKVEFHDDFLPEFLVFSESVRRQTYSLIEVLVAFGPQLGRPRVDTLKGSKHSNMKELRFRADDGAWRIAFDSKRQAILLVGGDESGGSESKFYRELIQTAERRLDQHERSIAKRESE